MQQPNSPLTMSYILVTVGDLKCVAGGAQLITHLRDSLTTFHGFAHYVLGIGYVLPQSEQMNAHFLARRFLVRKVACVNDDTVVTAKLHLVEQVMNFLIGIKNRDLPARLFEGAAVCLYCIAHPL